MTTETVPDAATALTNRELTPTSSTVSGSSAVARIARAHELPFYAIKAISDDADFELPDMQRFSTSRGQLREAAFGIHAALRPSLWPPIISMAKSSKLAAERLHVAIQAHIQQHRDRIS